MVNKEFLFFRKFRESGNDLYRNKRLWEALECYTKSACKALPDSDALALAFANRLIEKYIYFY